jgi:hypothetical protein
MERVWRFLRDLFEPKKEDNEQGMSIQQKVIPENGVYQCETIPAFYAVIDGEVIGLAEYNPPIISLVKLLIRDWKEIEVVRIGKTDYMLSYTSNESVIKFKEHTVVVGVVIEHPRLGSGDKPTEHVTLSGVPFEITAKESKLLYNIVKDLSKARWAEIEEAKTLRQQKNKERRERKELLKRLALDKHIRETYGV